MRMQRPDRARLQPVIVEYPQRADPHLGRVPVVVEREMPPSLEPTSIRRENLLVPPDLHRHIGPPLCCSSSGSTRADRTGMLCGGACPPHRARTVCHLPHAPTGALAWHDRTSASAIAAVARVGWLTPMSGTTRTGVSSSRPRGTRGLAQRVTCER